MKKFLSILLAAAMCFGLASAARAQEPFYRGKTVTFLISHAPGGGFDLYARLYARHLSKHLPGEPAIVVRNMPGAAGVVMANYMATQAATDGTVFGLGPGALVTAALFGMPGARYDARKFNWLGSMSTEVAVTVAWHNSPIKTAEDLRTKELVVGGGGATDGSVIFPLAVDKLLGLKIKVIPGYNGTAAIALAMERGETAGIGAWNYSSIMASKPSWLSEKKINILAQLSLEPHPDLPNVPTVLDLSSDEKQRRLLKLVFAQSAVGRAIYAPPGLPDERVKQLRDAFDAIMVDPEFLADAKKSNLEINQPKTGKEIASLIEELHQNDPAIIQQAAKAIVP